jgi:hypothetical protein
MFYEKDILNPVYIDNQDDANKLFDKMVNNPIQNLFIWALLLDRIEIAKIFWMIGNVYEAIFFKQKKLFLRHIDCNCHFKHHMAYSLLAATLLNNMSAESSQPVSLQAKSVYDL